jgi:hypothetical protein
MKDVHFIQIPLIVSREPVSLCAFKMQSEVYLMISSRFLPKGSKTEIFMDFLGNNGMGKT